MGHGTTTSQEICGYERVRLLAYVNTQCRSSHGSSHTRTDRQSATLVYTSRLAPSATRPALATNRNSSPLRCGPVYLLSPEAHVMSSHTSHATSESAGTRASQAPTEQQLSGSKSALGRSMNGNLAASSRAARSLRRHHSPATRPHHPVAQRDRASYLGTPPTVAA